MANTPPLHIQRAFLQPVVRVIRRLEIYEQDGTTPWRQDLWPNLLVGGSISVDYERDERRSIDLELDNSDGDLNPEAGKFWYDKIIKIFYGISMDRDDRPVRVAIVEQYNAEGQAFALKQALSYGGITEVHYLPTVNSYDQIQEYDVLVAISGTSTQKAALLTQCYNLGKSVITFSMNQSAASLPLVVGNAGGDPVTAGSDRRFAALPGASSLSVGWDEWSLSDQATYRKVLSPASGAQVVAKLEDDQGESVGAVARDDGTRRWVHVVQSSFEEDQFVYDEDYAAFAGFVSQAVRWASTYTAEDSWEMQIGEYLPDSISDGGSYSTIRVTGRDLTKLAINSKLAVSTTFSKDTPIEQIVKAVASNAGITKLKVPVTNKVLEKDTTWERGTARWEIIKEVCNTNNHEVYMDHEGYLVMREYLDPLLSPISLTLSGGIGGNLISRGARTSDSKLINHIVVVGESSDSTVPPAYAEAINNDPKSPTSVQELGDRVEVINSALITSVPKAQELAKSMLAVSSLEEFELSFESTLLPWVEPGEIIDMSKSDSRYWGPDRYLLTSVTLPLDLTPMSGNGKRIERVVVEDEQSQP